MDLAELLLTFPNFFEKCLAPADDPCMKAYSPILARSSDEYLYRRDNNKLSIIFSCR